MAQEFGEDLGVFNVFHSPSHPGHFLVIPAFPHPAVLTLVLPRVVCVLSLIPEPQGSLLGQADVPQVSFPLLLPGALPEDTRGKQLVQDQMPPLLRRSPAPEAFAT